MNIRTILSIGALPLLLSALPSFAQDAASSATPSADELAKQLSNPVSSLISVPV